MNGWLFKTELANAIEAGLKTQTRRLVDPRPLTMKVRGRTEYADGIGEWIMMALDLDVGGKTGHVDPVFVSPAGELRAAVADLPLLACAEHMSTAKITVNNATAVGLVHYVKEPVRIVAIHGKRDEPGCEVSARYQRDDAVVDVRFDRPLPKAVISSHREGKPLVLFMPHELGRLRFRINSIRIHRLDTMSEADAIAEGITEVTFTPDDGFPPSLGYMAGPNDGHTKLDTTAVGAFAKLWDSINGSRPGGATWATRPWVWAYGFERVDAAVTHARSL